jgi:hypothetical protein
MGPAGHTVHIAGLDTFRILLRGWNYDKAPVSLAIVGIIAHCLSKKLFSYMFVQIYVLTVILYALVH